MPRPQRTNAGNYIYHVLNRANARVQIFDNDEDYELFETILAEGKKKFDMRILSYCIMPNHWHLVLYPKKDNDLSKFMAWVTNTHTRRWHTSKGTIGQGHLYQGRFKSFICQSDTYFLALVLYVERNAKKANLVQKAEDWKWGSVWRVKYGTLKQKQMIDNWPVFRPKHYFALLNERQKEKEEKAIEVSMQKGSPLGEDKWTSQIIRRFNLESTVRAVGRPKKGG